MFKYFAQLQLYYLLDKEYTKQIKYILLISTVSNEERHMAKQLEHLAAVQVSGSNHTRAKTGKLSLFFQK